LREISEHEAREIGRRAQERVLAEHSAERRASQFEDYVGAKTLASQFV
jgi:spore maturation protein CgeB